MSVHLDVADGVGTIRLDRPPMNALDIATQDRLGELAAEVTERKAHSEGRTQVADGDEVVAAGGQRAQDLGDGGDREVRHHVASEKMVELLLLNTDLIDERHRVVLGLGEPRLHIEAFGPEHDLLGKVIPRHAVHLLIHPDGFERGFERALSLQQRKVCALYIARYLLPPGPKLLPRDLALQRRLFEAEVDLVELR